MPSVLAFKSRGRCCALAIGALLLLAIASPAQTEANYPGGAATPAQVVDKQRTERPGEDRLRVPMISTPLTLSDFEGMAPRPGLRDSLGHVASMTQFTPRDGNPATEKTEVWLGRTATTLYVAFMCFDRTPAQIRGHVTRRDQIGDDDRVRLILDSLQDHRRGVMFQVNPVGVQADASFANDNNDYSYDLVWDSEGRRTAQGWMALMAIPFKSLRSRVQSTEWGVVMGRNIQHASEQDNWPRISQQISGTLNQEATLTGMEGAKSANFQVNPYGILQRRKEVNADDPLNPFFSKRNLVGTEGADAKAIVKDTIVLDATVNPDFSQVESDAPQFRVNQRFALFYPEQRPFFLENSSYFEAPVQLLYTRTIVNPEFGFRATGKIAGRTNIGLLAIDDRAPGRFIAQTDPLFGKRAVTFVSRVSQDLGRQSSVGVMYAQRTLANSANRAGGIDFNAYLSPHWTVQGMMVLSSTHLLDGTYSAGPARRLQVSRNGRNFGFYGQYRDFSQGYLTTTGFVTIPHVRQFNVNPNYTWLPSGHAIQKVYVQSQHQVAWNRKGERVFHYNENDFGLSFRRQTQVFLFGGQNSDSVGPADFSALTKRRNFTENYVGLRASSAPVPQLQFDITAIHGATVNYAPTGAAPPALLTQDQVRAYVTVQPVSPLTVDNTYLLDRSRNAATGAFAYESQTFRTNINYQFTRALGARAIVQYDSVLRNPLVSALDRTKQLSAQILLSWLPHPGTAIYVGYNSHLQNMDRILCNRTPSGACDANNTGTPRSSQYLNDGRNLFVKVSYLYRF